MPKSDVGIWIKSTPLKYVEATNPVKSPITPPPNAIIKSLLVKLKSKSASYTVGNVLKFLVFSPGSKDNNLTSKSLFFNEDTTLSP